MDQPLKLDCGIDLAPFQIAYQTYGELNAERSNAIMIFHALTGDQHVANVHPVTGKPGWWETMVGPGRPLDPDRYFIICTNVIGGCMGSTGPASTNPATGKLWGPDFPVITIPDMVRAQTMLIDRLGIETLFSWSAARWVACRCCNGPRPIRSACSRRWRWPAAPRHSAQNIAFHELGRQAVMADPDWHHGRYFEEAPIRIAASGWRGWPRISPICLTPPCIANRAADQDREFPTFSFDADFQVESYLRYQGSSFVERFDANSYLYLTRAMDYFDIAADHDGVLARLSAVSRRGSVWCVHQRLAVSDLRFAPHRACAQRQRRAGVVRGDRDRSRAWRIPVTSRSFSTFRAHFWNRRPRRAA